MQQINEYTDLRLKAFCIHCGVPLVKENRSKDHVPSQCLLCPPYPDQQPKVWICKSCNNGFSKDEQYLIALIGCVLSGTSEPSSMKVDAARRVLSRSEKLKQRIEEARQEITLSAGNSCVTWHPELERVNRVILKNARGHCMFELGEPMLDAPSEVWSTPLLSMTKEQRSAFESAEPGLNFSAWPEVGSRTMTRLISGQDLVGPWIVVQDRVYRYSVEHQGERVLVKTILYEYLATQVIWNS
jgi:hypothetical protein